MFVSLVFDIILRPRESKPRRFGPFLHPIATIKRKLSPLGRSRQILGYARRRGLTHLRGMSAAKLATPEYARRLRLMLEDCGGMFVKFGQIASTRSDLLPEALTTELAQLQSSARPVTADESAWWSRASCTPPSRRSSPRSTSSRSPPPRSVRPIEPC